MRKVINKSLMYILAAALIANVMSCQKIDDGAEDDEKTEETEVIYDIAWVSKIPDGQWIKGSRQFFDGIYISDTLKVETIPEGGKPSWYIEKIDGDGLPSLTYPLHGPLNTVDNLSMCPRFGDSSLEGEGNVSLTWRVVVKINVGTEHEKSITAEYYSLPRTDGLESRCFMYIDGEDPITETSYDWDPINMKVGDTLNIYTGKIPQDHTGQQYRAGWYAWGQPKDYIDNGIFKVLVPVPANKGQIVAVGVGDGYAFGRDIIVTETE